MMHSPKLLSLLLAVVAHFSLATASPHTVLTTKTCHEIRERLPQGAVVFNPFGPHRTKSRNDRHVDALSVNNDWDGIHPVCIVFPDTQRDVKSAVTTLRKHSAKNKRLVHRPGTLHWTTADVGVVISVANLNHVKEYYNGHAVAAGPGASWEDIAKELEPFRKTIGGPRAGIVVPGLNISSHLDAVLEDIATTKYPNLKLAGFEFVSTDQNAEALQPRFSGKRDRHSAIAGGDENGIITEYVFGTFDISKIRG